MAMDIERRDFRIPSDGRMDLRVGEEDGVRTISGWVAPWGVLSSDLGGFRERFVKGAFSEVLRSPDLDCIACFNHRWEDIPLARTPVTLRLAEDDIGLRFEFGLPSSEAATALADAIQRKDVRGTSFAFRAKRDRLVEEGETQIREVLEVESLRDVGPVNFPAYTDAAVAVRTLERLRAPAVSHAARSRELQLAGLT